METFGARLRCVKNIVHRQRERTNLLQIDFDISLRTMTLLIINIFTQIESITVVHGRSWSFRTPFMTVYDRKSSSNLPREA